MSLRTRILYIVVLVVSLYAVIDNGTLRLVASRFFREWEAEEGRADVESVIAAVNQQLVALEESARIWAHQDQTRRFVDPTRVDEREAFIQAELGQRAMDSAKVDLFYLCDAEGNVLWSHVRDPRTGESLPFTKTLPSQRLSPTSPLLTIEKSQQHISGMMTSVEHGPLLISSIPIQDSQGRSLEPDGRSDFQRPIYGNVIMGRFLEGGLSDSIGESTGCEVRFYARDPANMSGEAGSIIDGITSMEFNSETLEGSDGMLHAFGSLLDLRTRTPLVVEAIVDRKITRLGDRAVNYALLSTIGSVLLILFVLLRLLNRQVLKPLSRLTHKAVEIGKTENTTIRVEMDRKDEIGQLAREFDSMLEKLAQSRAEVVKTARKAGMSEIATGVLHNVGNVLNSVNVSANMAAKSAGQLAIADLESLVQILEQVGDNLGDFISHDARGKHLMPFLQELTQRLSEQQAGLLSELRSLTAGIDHIADLVRSQQSYAGAKGVLEFASLKEEFENAVHICNQAIDRNADVELVREFADVGTVKVDKHKLMEILVNLIQNAYQALAEQAVSPKRITLRILSLGESKARIEVEDNGMGISQENQVKVFQHGFTTRAEGHGFGLHVSANAATEMNASLQVRSAGPDCGATFYLDLPIESPELLSAA